MAILGEIRKRVWILIALVALAMFAFLFSPDCWSGYFKSDPNLYGKVNGDNISRQEFSIINSFMQSRSQGQSVSEEQTWKMMVQNKLIAQKFDEAGMELTDETFWDYAQYSSLFANEKSLFDEKGNFNPKPLIDQIEKLKTDSKTSKEAEASYNQWLEQKKIAEYEIKGRLYFDAVTKGLFTNKKEIELIKKQKTQTAQVDFVQVSYDQYNQKNKVTLTDDDYKAYIAEHPNRFKREASVGLKYLIFDNKPTANDDSVTLKSIKLFATGGILRDENNEVLDSVKTFASIPVTDTKSEIISYLDNFSDVKFQDRYVGIDQQLEPTKNWVKTANIGDTYGPYDLSNYYIISKLIGKKTSDSTLTKHILISYKGTQIAQSDSSIKRTKDQAKKLADSILSVVSGNPSKFIENLKYSNDKGSAQQGGEVGWTTPEAPKFVPAFQKFVDESPKGKLGVVETEFGFHVIQITDKKTGSLLYNVAHLAKEKKPSEKTTNTIYKSASTFAQSILGKADKDFVTLAKKNKYNLLEQDGITRFVGSINGIDPQAGKNEEILSWAFGEDTKVGDSNIFTSATNDHFVVMLTAKNEKGLATPAMVKTEIEIPVRNKKIAKLISDKINGSKKSLDAYAKEFTTTKQSSVVTFDNPMIANTREPKVAGAALGIKPNTVSKAIEGNNGVYIITTKTISNNGGAIDVNQIKQEAKQQKQSSPYYIISSIENNSKIEDLRIDANQR